MEIKITTNQILNVLHIISWIIFIGLCVEAGSFFFNAVFTAGFNPNAADYFGLTDLYARDPGNFLVFMLLMAIPAVMKALLFYLIVKLFYNKKLDMAKPFNKSVVRFTFLVSYISFGIGLFTNYSVNYARWLISQNIQMPDILNLGLGGGDVWLFMGTILLMVAFIFKRGIEIQSENDLTI